uniref:hypothetical protein n=1 Tax=uncultured Altererythrobacter sp. TaxID=500840 RepID=UPI00260F2A12|nr:hypothetical protein [uncultured Altererythrobacter sp.]
MSGWLPLATTAGTVIVLVWSGFWANKHFADFDQLPGHFDWAGQASRLTPRRRMVWLLPIMFSFMMVAFAVMPYFVPGDYDPAGAIPWLLFTGASLLGAQAFVLWLTYRWAKQQRGRR